jgi:hypothetical protein
MLRMGGWAMIPALQRRMSRRGDVKFCWIEVRTEDRDVMSVFMKVSWVLG